MDISRSVSRFDAMVMLALAVLAALGLNWLIARLPPRRGRIAGRRHGADRLRVPADPLSAEPSPIRRTGTRRWPHDPRPGSVLNLPMNWDRPSYLLYQTVHGKPLSLAYISRDDPRTLTELASGVPAFPPSRPGHHRVRSGRRRGGRCLHDLGVRWVVLDRYKMPRRRATSRASTPMATAQAIFGDQPPAYQDDR